MKTEKQNKSNVTKILLLIYLIILIWIILFKMQFNIKYLPYIRSINVIPFAESVIINGKIDLGEIIDNLIVFIPVGAYIGMLGKEEKFYKKVIPIFLLTLVLEISQYILHIGATDITDVIMNTLGGIVGILLINFLYRIFKNNSKIDKILNILATICTIGVVFLMTILIVVNI